MLGCWSDASSYDDYSKSADMVRTCVVGWDVCVCVCVGECVCVFMCVCVSEWVSVCVSLSVDIACCIQYNVSCTMYTVYCIIYIVRCISHNQGGVCPFHYNHWSCDGMKGGGRDHEKSARCRCKVAFDLMNHMSYRPEVNKYVQNSTYSTHCVCTVQYVWCVHRMYSVGSMCGMDSVHSVHVMLCDTAYDNLIMCNGFFLISLDISKLFFFLFLFSFPFVSLIWQVPFSALQQQQISISIKKNHTRCREEERKKNSSRYLDFGLQHFLSFYAYASFIQSFSFPSFSFPLLAFFSYPYCLSWTMPSVMRTM
jgi:hypothetical protein